MKKQNSLAPQLQNDALGSETHVRSSTKNQTMPGLDLAHAHDLSIAKIAALTCPSQLKQAFLRDTKVPGLSVRVTSTGAKAFVLEKKFNGKTVRRTIGHVNAWSVEQARAEARHLTVQLDQGQDPRELERQEVANRAASAAQAATTKALEIRRNTTVREAWESYWTATSPTWSSVTRTNYAKMVTCPRPKVGKKGTTAPGILCELLALRLCDLTAERVEKWAIAETAIRPTATRVSWSTMQGLLDWCSQRDELYELMPQGRDSPYKSKRIWNALKKPTAKRDAILREQLLIWFKTVRALKNQIMATYLQTLLMTGARPAEIQKLRWVDINFEWRFITISPGMYDEREIPLTPYVSQLLKALPRRNSWVFPSGFREGKHISTVLPIHAEICKKAKIDHVTLQGLRRTFGSLSEWFDLPMGVVAQLQGHSPSATAEKHYRVRPVDLLRMYAELIEATFLKWAGVAFEPPTPPEFKRITLNSASHGGATMEDALQL